MVQIWSETDVARLRGHMSAAEQLELDTLLGLVPIDWQPLPGPQTTAYNSTADVIGFGGAAGGGKTDLAIGKALTAHRRVGVFRREGTEITAIVDRMAELLGHRNGYNGQDRIWRSPIKGVQIEFGSMPNPGDEKKYQGRPKDLLVIDEATSCLESQVRFLMGWVRTTTPGQLCQTLLTFNPPTSTDGRWVIDFFAPWLQKNHPNPAEPGELRYFAVIDGREVEVPNGEPFEHDGETITPQSRTFIPSRITDNPHLVKTGYMATLQALPEPLRSQMLFGDFHAGMGDDPWQVCPTEWVEAAMARWTPQHRKARMDSIGADIARGGKDETVIARRHGWWFDEPLGYPGAQTPDGPAAGGLIVAATRDNAPQHVDIIGVGYSVVDFLDGVNQQVIGVNVAEKSGMTDQSGRLRMFNTRTALWWAMREALDPQNNTGIALPPHEALKADLCAPRWSMRGPLVYVESREDIVKRLGRSPDYGSAYVLALMDTPRPRDLPSNAHDYNPYAPGGGTRGASTDDYDPYA